MINLIDSLEENKNNYIMEVSKNNRSEIAQFFTPKEIAKYMANLSETNLSEVKILDPGAGLGILSLALILRIISNSPNIQKIQLDLYEIDNRVAEKLIITMEEIKEKCEEKKIKFNYDLYQENFILSNVEKWKATNLEGEYDIIISNPPYKKLKKDSLESQSMLKIVKGQPNIYFLFMALSLKLLKENGEFIFITPRSYCNGFYFKAFREWFFSRINVERLHTFNCRKEVFNKEVLQETLILKGRKSNHQQENVVISESLSSVDNVNLFEAPSKVIIENGENQYIRIPKNSQEEQLLEKIQSLPYTINELGYKLSTGKIVIHRSEGFLKMGDKLEGNETPLIWMEHLGNGKLNWSLPNLAKPQIYTGEKGILPNGNYLILKRFSSKEEKRRLQCSIYLENDIPSPSLAFENHLTYFTTKSNHKHLTPSEVRGLYVLLNSTDYDNYFRILSGSTQVNSTEINSFPCPSRNILVNLGNRLNEIGDYTTEICDQLLRELVFNI